MEERNKKSDDVDGHGGEKDHERLGRGKGTYGKPYACGGDNHHHVCVENSRWSIDVAVLALRSK
ncbi:hypothetical protein LB503_005681 [Fusarium chuoi]|nr:hypothetical protein LB503_005681 [Fusarium chuoi]